MQRLLLLSLLFLTTIIVNAQSFTFADTYPTNNVDSLEHWIRTNPKATEERLKNLIRLERTYYWNTLFKLGTFSNEIYRLSKTLNNPIAIACQNYLKALLFSAQNNAIESIKHANDALQYFQLHKDNSGILHCYAVFVLNNSTIYGNKIVSDIQLSKGYLKNINELLLKTNSPHDELMSKLAYTRYLYGQEEDGIMQLRTTAEEALRLISHNYTYASYRFERLRALGFQIEGNIQQAYKINKKLKAMLRQNQEWEIATLSYNLATNCYILKYTDEGINNCKQCIPVIQRHRSYWFALAGPFTKYRELIILKGDYREANSLADSVSKYNGLVFIAENDKKMLELQSNYEFERNQTIIKGLENTSQRTLALLIICGLFIVMMGLFGYSTYRSNQHLKELKEVREQFFGIVAHDLRRPMYAFQNIKALVGFYLREQNYEAIEKLSIALDESGIKLQKMLDNLLNWAMSQQEIMPYQPENLQVFERVQTIVDLYRGVNLLKNVRFEVNINETLMAYADPNAFDLIVRNLIDNSFKVLSKEGFLRISALPVQNQKIMFVFEDDASGMNTEMQSIIQSVFDSPEKAQIGEKGMGMGLIMIGRFVKRNQGSIRVESELGKGTRFSLTLPSAQS